MRLQQWFQRLTQDQFIALAKEAHGDVYDYSLVEYINFRTPVTVICRKCGPFKVRPHLHTSNKTKCPSCNVKSMRGSLDEFVSRCRMSFDCANLDFSNTIYTGCKNPVTVKCKLHGEFTKRRAHDLWYSKGCPLCAKGANGQYKWKCISHNSDSPIVVYLVLFKCKATQQQFYKIGITKHSADHRLKGYTAFEKTELFSIYTTLEKAVYMETWATETFSRTGYNFESRFNGRTECYDLTPDELIACVDKMKHL